MEKRTEIMIYLITFLVIGFIGGKISEWNILAYYLFFIPTFLIVIILIVIRVHNLVKNCNENE